MGHAHPFSTLAGVGRVGKDQHQRGDVRGGGQVQSGEAKQRLPSSEASSMGCQDELDNGNIHYYSPDGGFYDTHRPYFRLDYLNIPKVVAPGQTVNGGVGWTVVTSEPQGAIVYKSLLAEWSPDTPIAVVQSARLPSGVGSPGCLIHRANVAGHVPDATGLGVGISGDSELLRRRA